ncbi:hypothetical protein GCM10023144_24860 [Pigmentiphaga soli]|uniref:DNA binding HTH domain-containing protein n=1 Tax=Pigmentiphaga soli TaxID=1007095 RepID=A0ABP8H320_9BURK
MRESIDCAVVMLPEHTGWIEAFLNDCRPARDRLRLHCIAPDGGPWHAGLAAVAPPADALRRAALALKRYDVCLLPVALPTLGWTRMALAAAQGAVETPLIGVVRDMTAAGMQDLLGLGMVDFLRLPVCAEELRIRLEQWAAPPSRPVPARRRVRRPAADSLPCIAAPVLAEPAEVEPFRSAKARIVTEFERHYVTGLLSRHQGNISQAARAARKNRRAFWQLMRKHDIAAEAFRPD